MRLFPHGLALVVSVIVLTACMESARLAVDDGIGPTPLLPPPDETFPPTLNIAKAAGWPAGAAPTPGSGLRVSPFATGLDHPRWLYVLPNGDALVAETNAPQRPADGKGLKGLIMRLAMKAAGASTPSANRITLLRDTDGDGAADERYVFRSGLNSPFGMALIGGDFYIADTDKVLRFSYRPGQTALVGESATIADLPAGRINHHWTKNIIARPDGTRLLATVGSNSNVGENGLAAEIGRAAIWEIDPVSGAHHVFASGLRNPNGMDWDPSSGALWTVVNERDEIGSDLVPDYMTAVREGGFYGWPFSYFGQHVDDRVRPARPDLVATALAPDYALGPHTASLGLAFARGGTALPAMYRSGAFIGQHGSWNRRPRSGYKVIFVPFAGGRPSGPPKDVLTGFLTPEGKAQGRPVGVAIDAHGGLLVADDVGNVVWRVSAAT